MSIVIYTPAQNNNVLRSVTSSTAITGTTSSTLSASYLIPANKILVGDILRYIFQSDKTGSAGVTTLRVYINTSASLSGATLLSTTTTTLASNICNTISRFFGVKSSSNTLISSVTLSYWPAENTFSTSNSLNIDWTIDQYLIIAVQNGSAADSTLISFVDLFKM